MKKLFLIIFVSVFSLFAVTLLTFGILGQKERIGFIEFVDNKSMENTVLDYEIRIRYYNKVFRNSDIYGVYPKDDNLPNYVASIKWDSDGSPFGILTAKEKVTNFENIENIVYSLKIKLSMWLYLILFTMLYPGIILTKLLLPKIKLLFKTKLLKCFSILLSNSKKCSILIASLFLIVTAFLELNLFERETAHEYTNVFEHPHNFIITSGMLHPLYLENTNFNEIYFRTKMHAGRRKIKNSYILYVDNASDNHILGNVYAALRTGKTLKELRSYNFNRGWNASENFLATKEILNTPTIYVSVPNLITKLIYRSFPKHLRNIDTIEKEIKAGYHIQFVKRCFLVIQIFLWALLIYAVGVRFNLLYAVTVAVSIFCNPGLSAMSTPYDFILLIPLFPAYIIGFYPSIVGKKINIKTIVFWTGLALLIFLQWNLVVWLSVFFQIPFILLSLALINFTHQTKDSKFENMREVLKMTVTHIKRYTLQYLCVMAFIGAVSLLVTYTSYREMITLQPEKQEYIYNSVFNRTTGGTTKLSLVLVDDWSDAWQEKYYATYSIKNFIKHTYLVTKHYIGYPAIYPMWRLEYLFPTFLKNILYIFSPHYISPWFLILLSFIINLVIIIRLKSLRPMLFMPFMFISGVIFWVFLFSSTNARFVTHLQIAPHLVLQYVSPALLIYIVYLTLLLLKNYVGRYNESISIRKKDGYEN